MMYQPKRQSAAIMALLVFFFAIVPAKRSEAIVPLVAFGMTVQALGAGGAVVSSNLLAATGTALIGGTIVALAITPSSLADGTNPLPIRVPTTTDQAKTDAVMPGPSAPTGSEVLPGIAIPSDAYCNRCATTSTSSCGYRELCSVCASGYGTTGYCLRSLSDGTYTGDVYTSQTTQPHCAAGYTYTNSSCVLSNPRAAVADGNVDYKRDATGVVSLSDADSAKAAGYSYSPGTGQIAVFGQGSDNALRVINVGKDGSGNTTVTIQTQGTAAGGTTTVNTQGYTLSGTTGQVLSYSGSNATGTISLAGSTPTVSTGTAAGVIDNVGAGTGTGTGEIVFPTDYARAGEAAQAANTVKTSVDQLKDKLNNSETVNDPTVPDWADHWGATFNPLKAWSMPGHSSVCPTSGFEWNGATYTISSHCQLIADHWSGLQSASVVVWTLFAIWILLGA